MSKFESPKNDAHGKVTQTSSKRERLVVDDSAADMRAGKSAEEIWNDMLDFFRWPRDNK
jgi:hypothetical protein